MDSFSRMLTKQKMSRTAYLVAAIFLLAAFAGFICYPAAWNKSVDWLNARKNEVSLLKSLPNIPQFFEKPFHLGLDLQGGTHLVYEAGLGNIKEGDYAEAMEGVRDVIERRINLFGVTEPVVQVDTVGEHHRLIVELAGVKDVSQAIEMIGETPSMDFREERDEQEYSQMMEPYKDLIERFNDLPFDQQGYLEYLDLEARYKPTDLTGKYLVQATLEFDQNTSKPYIGLEFNDEGAKFFEEITGRNVGKQVAIFLDGLPITAPVVQEAISGGRAQITGSFTLDETKELVRRLNAGALPVPITLINQQSVGASLGEKSLQQSLFAGWIGILAVALFMVFWYRLPGLLSVLALGIYTLIVLAIFKLIPVTMTLAGIAGFVLSVGMAVDANILIFERFKEELRWGKSLKGAIDAGFERAWTSIRDSNVSSLITCAVLFWLGTSIIKGFALTLAVGILVSMFSAITITRNFLKLLVSERMEKHLWWFGIKKIKN
ncbi:MAG: protein translocase subunit SecD [Candidatus Portnoybacteria bacterium]|jgi:protein-export membrane protein SecD|nr:protein translocase subunit SecD [Candidatus Portnoybacteria bacterium]